MKNTALIILLFAFSINAQVGVNNSDPKSSLDITSTTPNSPSANEGLLLPRINAFPATNPGVDQNAMMVYLNVNLTSVNISGTAKNYDAGYYYWDNAQTDWISFSGVKGWELSGNTVTATDFIGTINNSPLNIHVFNDKRLSITSSGQIVHHNADNTILLGTGSTGGFESVVIGNTATGNTSSEAVIIGKNAVVDGDYGIAIGDTAETAAQAAIAIGRQTFADGTQSTAVGYTSIANGNNSSAFGFDSHSVGDNSTALGFFTSSTGANSIAGGSRAISSGSNSAAIGHQAESTGNTSSALGFDALSSATQSTALGALSMASGSQSTAVGYDADATASSSIALGREALADRTGAIAIGRETISSGLNSLAIGLGAEATRNNSTAIGNGAIASSNNTIVLGNTSVKSVTTSGVMSADSFVATGSGTTYADYVFEDYFNGFSIIKSNYKFNSLNEAEAFVKRNGHLPGVKSYKDVMDGGFKLDITESTIINLEKIEEQFLYITELNKELKESKNLIKSQSDEIKSLKERLERIEDLLQK